MDAARGPLAGGAASARLEFVRKAEMQERGLIHYHVLIVEWDWIDIETVRLLAIRHGFGPRLQLQRPRSAFGMAAYFAKRYLAKTDGLPLPPGVRAIVYSQGWPSPLFEGPTDDPVVARPIMPGESWWDFAGRMIDRGMGSELIPLRLSGWIQPGRPIVLFDPPDLSPPPG